MNSDKLRRCSLVLSISTAAAMMAISGHQTAAAQQSAAKVEMPPAELPTIRVGDTSVWRRKNGEDFSSEITGVDDDVISGQNDDGCSYTFVMDFGPSLEWSGCGGSDGTQQITKQKGNLFPLQVGNTSRWWFRGKNTKGNRWKGSRKCEVKGTANVTVPAGNFDTYVVVCTEDWSRREWHYSPELGKTVTSRRKPKGTSKSKPFYYELVSFTPGT